MKVQQKVQTASLPHSPPHGWSHTSLCQRAQRNTLRRLSFTGLLLWHPWLLPEVKEAHEGTWVKAEEEKDAQYKVKIR